MTDLKFLDETNDQICLHYKKRKNWVLWSNYVQYIVHAFVPFLLQYIFWDFWGGPVLYFPVATDSKI